MVEAKYHLFQIGQKVAPAHSIITPELCLGERPEALDAVDAVPFPGKFSFPVVDPVMPVAVGKEAVVGTERVRVNGAAFRNLLSDDEPQYLPRDVRHGTGIDPAIALEKPENSDLSGRTPAAIAFTVAAEVALVHLNLSGERSIAFAFHSDGASENGIDALGAVPVDLKLSRGTNDRYLQREEMDHLPNGSIAETASLDEFLCHGSSIRGVEHLYWSLKF